MPAKTQKASSWWLNVLLCERNKPYIGIAKDVQTRFEMHHWKGLYRERAL
jgi:predicted GIY-YIG superfamily endonuclease